MTSSSLSFSSFHASLSLSLSPSRARILFLLARNDAQLKSLLTFLDKKNTRKKTATDPPRSDLSSPAGSLSAADAAAFRASMATGALGDRRTSRLDGPGSRDSSGNEASTATPAAAVDGGENNDASGIDNDDEDAASASASSRRRGGGERGRSNGGGAGANSSILRRLSGSFGSRRSGEFARGSGRGSRGTSKGGDGGGEGEGGAVGGPRDVRWLDDASGGALAAVREFEASDDGGDGGGVGDYGAGAAQARCCSLM